MQLHRQLLPSLLTISSLTFLAAFSVAQGSYRAQLRGVVSDSSGAMVANATVTIRDVGTNIATSSRTDDKGSYFFTGLRPSTYDVKAEAPGFRAAERTNVVLAVDQESSLNFKLQLAGVSSTVEVTTTAPLLDTGNATLGTDVTNKYVVELPLVNRDFFGLTFLAGGVTEAAGSGTQDNYPSGPISFPTASATLPRKYASMARRSAPRNRAKAEIATSITNRWSKGCRNLKFRTTVFQRSSAITAAPW